MEKFHINLFEVILVLASLLKAPVHVMSTLYGLPFPPPPSTQRITCSTSVLTRPHLALNSIYNRKKKRVVVLMHLISKLPESWPHCTLGISSNWSRFLWIDICFVTMDAFHLNRSVVHQLSKHIIIHAYPWSWLARWSIDSKPFFQWDPPHHCVETRISFD